MHSLKIRILRYINTWFWLIALNVKLNSSLLILTIVFGIFARLGTIAGFVISIKSAIWIFQPQLIPREFYEYLSINLNLMFGILIIVPGVVFLATGFSRYYHSNNLVKLQVLVSDYLAKKISLKRFEKIIDKQSMNKKDLSKLTNDLKTNHAQIFAVQGMLINLLVLFPVIFISLLFGIIINWIIVISILGFGIILITIFILKRHKERYELEKVSASLQTEKTSSVKDLINTHSDTQKDIKIITTKIKTLTGSISSLKNTHEKFRLNSDLLIDLGQSMIVIFFLYMLLNVDLQTMKPEYLVILALLFRFIISYGKAIVQVVLKLNTLYKFVTDVKNTLSTNE